MEERHTHKRRSRNGVDLSGRPHLRQHLVQPHERPVKVDLNPAGRAGDILPVVLGTPPLHKAHANGAHLGQLVDGLKALVDREGQQLGKLLVVEDLEAAARRNLAHRGRVEAMGVVALPTLDKYGPIAEALCKHLPSHVEEVHPLANVAPDVLNGGVAVDIGEEAETEAVEVGGGVGEAVHHNVGARGVEGLAHALVQLVVADGAPVRRLLVLDGHRHGHLRGGRGEGGREAGREGGREGRGEGRREARGEGGREGRGEHMVCSGRRQ